MKDKEFKTVKSNVVQIYTEFGIEGYAQSINSSEDLVDIYGQVTADISMLKDVIEKIGKVISDLDNKHPDINFGYL